MVGIEILVVIPLIVSVLLLFKAYHLSGTQERKAVMETKGGIEYTVWFKPKEVKQGILRIGPGSYVVNPRYFRPFRYKVFFGLVKRWGQAIYYREGSRDPLPLSNEEVSPEDVAHNALVVSKVMDSKITEAALRQPMDILMLLLLMAIGAIIFMVIVVAKMSKVF